MLDMIHVSTDTQLTAETIGPLVEAFLSGRKATTLRTYRQAIEDFRQFVNAADLNAAARLLLSGSHGQANALALAYRANIVERDLSASTVNNRLSALRSLVTLARTLGVVPWTLEVKNVRSTPYRDTKGTGRNGFRKLVDELTERETPKAKRDLAAVRLLYDLALRRDSVVSLDVEHIDLEAGTISVLCKGYTERETRTLPEPTQAVIRAWLAIRGDDPGPLFLNFDRAGKGGRLTGTSLYRIVRRLGSDTGQTARPHGLRHAAITEALDVTDGDVRAVARFSGHKKIETLMLYDDNRNDLGGEVAKLVARSA